MERYTQTPVTVGGRVGHLYAHHPTRGELVCFRADEPGTASVVLKRIDANKLIEEALASRRVKANRKEAKRLAAEAIRKSEVNTARELERKKVMMELRKRWAAEDAKATKK